MSGSLLGMILVLVGPPTETATAPAPEQQPAPLSKKEARKQRQKERKARGEFMNAFSVKGAYAFLLLKDRDSHVEGEEAPEQEHLWGFEISYERTLIENWLSIELAKPFLFTHDRFDSPFDLKLKLIHRWKFVEPYVGTGLTLNVRVFEAEREEIEGRNKDLSFGIVATTGCAFWVSRRWGLEVEAGYAFIPVGHVVNHEITAGFGPLLAF
jgi:hypothetical protein